MDKLKYIPGDLCIVKGKIESVCEVDEIMTLALQQTNILL